MSRVLRLRRGTTAQTAAFTGKLAEVSVDTDTFSLVVHDNITPGGHRIATEAYVESNKAVTSTGNAAPSQDVTEGSMWFDSGSGRLYVNYNGAWIDASPTVENSVIGNLQVDDTTISSEGTNKSITLAPTGTGNVNLNANVHVEASYLRIGSNDELVIRYTDGVPNANPYNRISITTALNSNANIGLSLSSTTTSSMFFNPQTGNIGINTQFPTHPFQVNGSFRSNSSVVSNGYSGGYQFNTANLGSTGLYHIVPGNSDPSSVKILHDGVDLVSFFDNNFVSYGGNIAVYSDFSIGGNATLPNRTTIGGAMSFTPQNAKIVYADEVDGFSQFAMQNTSNGTSASADIALFADNGDDNVNYVDMGITSSTYNDPAYDLYGPNDAYLINASGNGSKLILNTYNDSDIVFATGGGTAANEIARFQNGEGLVMHGNVIPASNVTYNLGAPGNEWNSLYVSNNTIYLGGIPLSIDNTNNLTVDGNPVGSGALAPSSSAPGSASEGQLWFDVEDGHLYVRYANVWVDTTIAVPASNLPTVEITATSTPGYYIGQGNITINVSSTTTPTAVGVLMMSAIDGGYIPANIWAGTNTTGSQTIHYTGWGSGSHYIAQAYATNTSGTAYSAPVVGQSDYCFAKGTLITLADGTTKPVEQITYADRIMTWDLDNAQFTHSRPMWIKKAETADWYSRYTFSDGTELKLVATHRIFNKQAGKFTSPVNAILQKYLTGKNLPVKDETPSGTVSFNSAGEEVTLVHKEHVWETVEHYSLIVDYHMNTFANGIMTGHAQSSIYPIVDMKFVKDDRTVRDISEFEGIPERFVKGMRLQEQDFDLDYVRSVIDILLSKEIAFSQAEAA